MICDTCKSNMAVECSVRYANVLTAVGFFCSRACMRKGMDMLLVNNLKSLDCMDKNFEGHLAAECDCIRTIEGWSR
jgi:hypothetical protein